MKKLIFASFIIALAFSACSKKTATTTIAAHPIEITDYAERTVILEKPAQKIVVMADNALAVVKHLNAIDTVIALDSKTKGYLPISLLSETDPNLHNLPDVGKTKSPNYEYIISLAPDLILFKGNKDSADMLQEKTGVPVACILSNMGDYDFDLYAKIGKLLGKDSEAQTVTETLKKQKSSLENMLSALTENQKKSAYIVLQNSKNNLFKTQKTCNSLDLAGIANVSENANNVNEWGIAEISKEEFLHFAPDFIFLDLPTAESNIHKEDLQNDETFAFLKAVKENRIFHTHSFSLPKNYAYVIAEAYYYASLAYPEIVTEEVYKNAVNDIFRTAYGIENYYEEWKKSLL